ncbi:MAG: type II/IV secretion system protein [Magnetococcales bacterium]|nr:type II/IV secretion system protein [Magnetococcales bacterium]
MTEPVADKSRSRLGELLLKGGIITEDYLDIALLEQKKTQERLGHIFVKLGLVPEATMRDLLGSVLQEESIDLDAEGINPAVVQLVPKKLVDRYCFIPVAWDEVNNTLTVAMPDSSDIGVLDKIRAKLRPGVQIKTLLAGESEIGRAIDKYYGFELSLDGIMRELETGTVDLESLSAVGSGEFSHPMVRLVDALLADAVRQEASDIHVEPEAGFVRVRYRIDGVLTEIRSMHKDYLSGLVVRIKILSGMNIAETRAPQDGRFSISISRRVIDFRVSSMPTTHGENMVLRVLDRNKGFLPLEQLGLADETLLTLLQVLARPEGIVLVTGPTGSGKTTTLYSMINFLNTKDVNIMTLEDPVEYPMGIVRQTPVNPAANLGFSEGIRSILRQDPDIILVGEIRDQDTAQMALRAAMTGHKVFSTLHTNSALGAFPRLLDIGINAEILAGNVSGVVAQRLVRKLCKVCRRPGRPTAPERRVLELEPETECTIYRPVGCEACAGIGYKGRTAVMEVVRVDDDFDDLIAHHATKGEFIKLAAQKGFRTLAQDGKRLVLQGIVSVDEISRVLDLSDHVVV